MKHSEFDVIVIGAGHAGSEAAHACHRAGLSVALITMSTRDLGALSCNPAVGGVGKGHLVREIDAMGGIMGYVADRAAIHYRLLNRRKGPAVHGPRAQMDRDRYHTEMTKVLSSADNITLIYDEVVNIVSSNGHVTGVVGSATGQINAKNVVLTTGTFLGGKIFVGHEVHTAGRMGDNAAVALRDQLLDLGLPKGRLKTGTPPRLRRSTIDWDCLEKQPTDDEKVYLSQFTRETFVEQVDCAITHTNERTHGIIRDNLDKSAMYGGVIESSGPRYCPSIEDKVVRFSEKNSHQVFLEPEGLHSDLVYPNGISTSLPSDVQYDYVRSITGLERAEIVQPGYAVEYNYFDPRCLTLGLEVKDLPGLYFAGQINGTTGYEEAAAQGMCAALSIISQLAGQKYDTFTRSNSYIGVMVDDLVSRGVSEPYRMFTSRAEYRLLLRYDNADERLARIARTAGLVDDDKWGLMSSNWDAMSVIEAGLRNCSYTPSELEKMGVAVNNDGRRRSILDLLVDGRADLDVARGLFDGDLSDAILVERVVSAARYSQYSQRHERQFKDLNATESMQIPKEIDYKSLSGLSDELATKLSTLRPSTVGHAMKIEGMTPAAGIIVMAAVKLQNESAHLK